MAEFGSAGKKPGLAIWRIENMVPTTWASDMFGSFCKGDAYICLHTMTAPGSSSLAHDIHFWLGSECSQDEAGVAAYKTVELDDALGGSPVQYRETEGNESERFLSMFKNGVTYLAGGVASGFKKVERDVYETRLLHLKGKRSVRVAEVPVAASSLNSGDVFVLDCGLTIYQWNGKECNRTEKAKALAVTSAIKDNERGGRARIEALEEGSESDAFWTAIGGKGAVKSAEQGGCDEQAERLAREAIKLFRLSDASGAIEFEEVQHEGALKQAMLDTKDVFIVDSGTTVFVWTGKGASKDERSNGMKYASDYLSKFSRPPSTKVMKMNENAETPLFKDVFADWHNMRPPMPKQPGVPQKRPDRIDIDSMVAGESPEEAMVDDGSGSLMIWRIEDMAEVPVPENNYGQFYGGDTYIVKYTYMDKGRESYILYFWQGRESSNDEKGASALIVVRMDDELGGAATQVRIVQGKEPNHFLSLFKGKFVVHSGGKASGFKNRNDGDSYDVDGTSLFHIKGSNDINTHAVQVEEVTGSLNSGDCFVLETPSTLYVWCGKGSNDHEQEVASKVAAVISPKVSPTVLKEGDEPDEFWAAIGGKGEYADSAMVEGSDEPRLFACSNASGSVVVEEIFNYSQDDLEQQDVFLLDMFTELYVWVGNQSNKEEQTKAIEVAQKYLDGKGNSDVPVVRVAAGSEPPMFRSAFIGWNAAEAKVFEDPYEKKLRLIREAQAKEAGEEPPAATPAAAPSSSGSFADPATTSYPLADVQNKTAPDMDPKHRELYLSDDDFKKLFKMTKEEFGQLKGWKQEQMKKANKLF